MPRILPSSAPADVSLENLETPASGHFHLLDDALTAQEATDAMTAILQNSGGVETHRETRAAWAISGINYWASFLCFQNTNAPSFLPRSRLVDQTYGFVLLVELEVSGAWFIGIFKKGATGVEDALENILKPPSRKNFTRAFGKEATYQKLSLKRMTASKHELIASSYEASDLKNALPTLGVTRSVPRSLRIQHQKHGCISITPGTFRLQRSGGRCGIDDLAQLVILVAKEISQSSPNEFLDVLPQEVDFSTKPKTLRPTGVLVELGTLFETQTAEVWRTKTNGTERRVPAKLLLRTIGGALDSTKRGTEWDLKDDDGNIVGSLKEAARGYSLARLLHHSIEVRQNIGHSVEKCRLATWINRNDLFRVVFSQPDYFYSGGQLYRRLGFDADVSLVRRAIKSNGALSPATSEKGKTVPADTQFPVNSIFRITEDALLSGSEYLWCSDLGDEWADYISLKDGRIIFAHCKHGKKTKLGATSYQEVLGQAMKNLGNVKSTPGEFAKKIKAAASTSTWGSTGIHRLRTPQKTWADFETELIARIGNPNFVREVQLVITMLSEAEFDAEARKPKKKASFTQLIWLLSSFINSCRELGATPQIVCKP